MNKAYLTISYCICVHFKYNLCLFKALHTQRSCLFCILEGKRGQREGKSIKKCELR